MEKLATLAKAAWRTEQHERAQAEIAWRDEERLRMLREAQEQADRLMHEMPDDIRARARVTYTMVQVQDYDFEQYQRVEVMVEGIRFEQHLAEDGCVGWTVQRSCPRCGEKISLQLHSDYQKGITLAEIGRALAYDLSSHCAFVPRMVG